MGAKGSGKVVGYKYFLGMHLVLCYGPIDKITKILFNDKVAWTGSSTGATITVNEPSLFGGKEREGGVAGLVDLEFGQDFQAQNPYLLTQLGANIPAFRGVAAAVFNQFYVGNNPYLKPVAIECTRTQVDTDGNPSWNIAKSDINNGDLNPINVLYECLTNAEWGMGYGVSSLDLTTFLAAADTVFTEGLGFSLLWTRQETLSKFIQNILNHVSGILVVSPLTGLFIIKLFRDDYNPATLPVFNEDNIVKLDSHSRRAWGETINEITVIFKDRSDDDKNVPISIQDTANIQFQGSVINQTLQFPAVTNETTALHIAQRELKVVSSPLAKLVITVNRTAWALTTGDVFKLSWDELGIVSQIYRIMDVDTGTVIKGTIKIVAVEDIFSAPSAIYAGGQGTLWVDPVYTPQDLIYQRAEEANFWDVQNTATPAAISNFTSGFGFATAIGTSTAPVNYGFDMLTRVGSNPFVSKGNWPSSPSADIVEALTKEVTSVVTFTNDFLVDIVDTLTYAYVNNEIVEVEAIDPIAKTLTLNRGILDTTPVAHTAGSRIFFSEDFAGFDLTEYTATDVVNLKLLEFVNGGTFDEASATQLSITMDNRYARPYAPGNVKMNTVAYPDAIIDDLALTWSHRDRTQQTAYLVNQGEIDIGPEAGITYTLRIYNSVDSLINTQTGLTANNFTYTLAQEIIDDGAANDHLRIELESLNGATLSHQRHDIAFDRAGYGYRYGEYYGGV